MIEVGEQEIEQGLVIVIGYLLCKGPYMVPCKIHILGQILLLEDQICNQIYFSRCLHWKVWTNVSFYWNFSVFASLCIFFLYLYLYVFFCLLYLGKLVICKTWVVLILLVLHFISLHIKKRAEITWLVLWIPNMLYGKNSITLILGLWSCKVV